LSAAGQSLPVEYFTRNDSFGTVKISPDGDFLAATAKANGVSTLVFINLDNMVIEGGLKTRGADEITDFDWVSNTRVVYSYAERYLGNAYATNTGEIFAVNRDGSRDVQLYGYRAGDARIGSRLSKRDSSNASGELLSVLRDDDDRVLILERPFRVTASRMSYNPDAHPRVATLDVYGNGKSALGGVPLSSADVIVDRHEQVRFAVGYDKNTKLAVIWRPGPDAPWTEFELPGFREESVVPRRFTADDRSVLFTAIEEGEAVEALYRLDLESTAIERLYRHTEFDIANVVTDLTGDAVVGVSVYADKLEYHWLNDDDPTARLYEKLQRAFAGQSVAITSLTKDGKRAVVYVYSDTNPGDYYLFRLDNNSAAHLQSARDWVDPEMMRPKEPIIVAARDGQRLHGYLTRPADDAGPFPLIVLPHGGPHEVRDTWGFDWEVQLLANRGYAVLQINFRGSGGYGVDFAKAGYGEWGALMQDDITDATRWAISEGITNADKICIFGASYGGYAAMMGVIREPDLYRCAVAHAGVYDLELMYKAGDTRSWRIGRSFLERALGSDTDLLRKRSPVHNVSPIRAPVLLVHGKNDWRADYEHAVRMRKALEKADKQMEWLSLSREGHGVSDEQTRKEVYEQILDFLDRHLPVGGEGKAIASAD
jgi:dipeptidyl aminopeptidase/acylaminoacyl peptidase